MMNDLMLVDCTLVASAVDHFTSQAETGARLRSSGFDVVKWVLGSSGGRHVWRVRCTKQELTQLSLMCESVSLEYNRKLESELATLRLQMATTTVKINLITREIVGNRTQGNVMIVN